MTVNQVVNRNVFKCLLKTKSKLHSKMFEGRRFQIVGAE